ncbi:MAG TPA: hypothetical protein VK140_11950 [Ktedonobacteraceae bacterium]|nr:hypothetical protein [Ktedonobacteraceae bacterium]
MAIESACVGAQLIAPSWMVDSRPRAQSIAPLHTLDEKNDAHL